ncbi:MAG: hypothetical protein K2X99_02565 [Gemmatimonadaceae bacterium]|nr:hypothetical protein [Gemmatimonadaceae bacterium]
MKVALIGMGRMGQALDALAAEHGLSVVARLDGGSTITHAALGGAEVAIEFTVPTAAASNILSLSALGVPVVSGTTGWDAEVDGVASAVRASPGALLWAPNFSLGVHLFLKVGARAGRLFAGVAGFEVAITETHHTRKLDAPSGTARALATAVEGELGRAVPITSVRTGEVTGTHLLTIDGVFEQLRLEHIAHDRRVFAAGALTAARWLAGRRGVFTLDDVLGIPLEDR